MNVFALAIIGLIVLCQSYISNCYSLDFDDYGVDDIDEGSINISAGINNAVNVAIATGGKIDDPITGQVIILTFSKSIVMLAHPEINS